MHKIMYENMANNFECNLPKGTRLCRYDLKNTPNNWDCNYKSLEYEYVGLGPKNKIGAFFFYNSLADCERTAQNAHLKHEEAPLWITETELLKEVNLLDLRESHIVRILDRLFDAGIDVLRGDFVNHLKESNTYFSIRSSYLQIKQCTSPFEGLKHAREVLDFWGKSPNVGGNYDYLGQQLTDFDNGEVFKQLLQEKGLCGYCFYEGSRDGMPQVTTYCLFSSACLGAPIKERKI